MIKTSLKAVNMYYFKTFPDKAVTLYFSSLYFLQSPVWVAEEGRAGWSERRDWADPPLVPAKEHPHARKAGTGPSWPGLSFPLSLPASQNWHSPWGAERDSPLPGQHSGAGDQGETGDRRGSVTVLQAAAAFLLAKESHCSEMASLWPRQFSGLSNIFYFITCIFSFCFFFFFF